MSKEFTIVVLAKQVPDTRNVGKDAMTPEGTVNRAALPAIFNPEDMNALEQALRIKDKFPGSKVLILTMGPFRAAEIIREGYFRGTDGGVLLTDRRFAGADTLATSYAISQAVKKLNPDIIVAGRQAIDGDTAQVGPEMAEHLALPQVSYVVDCEYKGGNNFRVKKETEDGYEILDVEGPAVFTVLASGYKARYMSVGGIVDAFDREVEIWTEANLDLDPGKLGLKGSPTKVMKAFTKATKAAGQVYEVDAEQAVDVIISKMKEKFII